jgi:hypothetical protein
MFLHTYPDLVSKNIFHNSISGFRSSKIFSPQFGSYANSNKMMSNSGLVTRIWPRTLCFYHSNQIPSQHCTKAQRTGYCPGPKMMPNSFRNSNLMQPMRWLNIHPRGHSFSPFGGPPILGVFPLGYHGSPWNYQFVPQVLICSQSVPNSTALHLNSFAQILPL